MESRSTIVRYFSLVSLLSISCMSFAADTAKDSKSSTLEPKVLKAYALGAVAGSAGTMAYTNKALIAERSNAALTYLKSFRSVGTVVASEVSSVVAEATPAVATPSRFAGIIASVQSGISSGLVSAKAGISSGLTSVGNGFVSGLASAKAGISSGLTSAGNSFVSAKNAASAFGSKQLENAGYYVHKGLTGSKDCGNAVLEAVKTNPKTSGSVVVGAAAIGLAVYHRKALAQKAGQAYNAVTTKVGDVVFGTAQLLKNNAYVGSLAAIGTAAALYVGTKPACDFMSSQASAGYDALSNANLPSYFKRA